MKKKNINELAFQALKEAVEDVRQERIRWGLPMWVYRDGKVMAIDPVTGKEVGKTARARKQARAVPRNLQSVMI